MVLGYSRTIQFPSTERSSLPVAGEPSHIRCLTTEMLTLVSPTAGSSGQVPG